MIRTKLIGSVFLGIALALALTGCASVDDYPGYQWLKVANGVYLHTASNPLAGPVDGNSVVIDTGKGLIIIDSHINPAAARAVIDRIAVTIKKPVTHVVNTHWHDDHTNGNYAYREAYPAARIVAHTNTLKALKKEWAPMKEQRQTAYKNLTPEKLFEAADNIDDDHKALGYRIYAAYIAALKPELETMQLVYPDTVFESELTLGSDKRRVELKWLGRGNTDGDVIVWVPDERLLITGDLLVSPIPFAFDAPMTDWIYTLEKLQSMRAKIIVPGHGAVQTNSDYLEQVLLLLRETVAQVRNAKATGAEFGDLNTLVELSDFEQQFTLGDAEKTYAWHSYFLSPALKSAWVSLGYALPPE